MGLHDLSSFPTFLSQFACGFPPLTKLAIEEESRLSRRELIELRAGRSKPHRKNQELLAAILKNLSLL
jgi:hypothetical protein